MTDLVNAMLDTAGLRHGGLKLYWLRVMSWIEFQTEIKI
jgi:hypothetical protein